MTFGRTAYFPAHAGNTHGLAELASLTLLPGTVVLWATYFAG
jgi:hypothetical protein